MLFPAFYRFSSILHSGSTALTGLWSQQISPEQQKPFINLVDQILKKKKDNPNADTGELEREIDEMVYELYGLTEEEIGIVEGKMKK
ncbi:MAG: hypothetical protein WA063_00210 [Minisyncoccia bacterium]